MTVIVLKVIMLSVVAPQIMLSVVIIPNVADYRLAECVAPK
jgi:hypothetical protein